MISICLCDDDITFLDSCTEIIRTIETELGKTFNIKCFTNGESLLFALDDDVNKYDILIMDMIMKQKSGMETTKELRSKGFIGDIIFLSSSKEYAIESFEVEPLYYVLKNSTYKDKLKEILTRAIIEQERKSSQKIIFTMNKKNIIVELKDIIYIESMNKKIILHKTTGDNEECNLPLNKIVEKIEPYGFLQCHKSYIINQEYVEVFTKLECRLRNGITIPIGRKYATTFAESLAQYEFDHIVL
ncbi:two-component response regulator [Lachnospiraceae bacterium KM106-2]|nr:two-component response regulator [Lachnospiraceae bacterium KM106-2]